MQTGAAFTIDAMLEAVKKLEAIKPAGGFIRDMVLGERAADYFKPAASYTPGNLWGVPVKASGAFPFQQACVPCQGAGYGTESTFCPKCGGAGEIRYEGMAKNDCQTILITSKLPRKAYVRWPENIGVPLRALEAS